MRATSLIFAILLFSDVFCLYKDEAGLLDWNYDNIGRVSYLRHDRSKKFLVVSQRANVVAGLNSSTGKTEWRQVLPHDQPITAFATAESMGVFVVSGRHIRYFSSGQGAQVWEALLPSHDVVAAVALRPPPSKGGLALALIALSSGDLEARDARSGAVVWRTTVVPGAEVDQATLHVTATGDVFVVRPAANGVAIAGPVNENGAAQRTLVLDCRPKLLAVTTTDQLVALCELGPAALHTCALTDDAASVTPLHYDGSETPARVLRALGGDLVALFDGAKTAVMRVRGGDVAVMHVFAEGETVAGGSHSLDTYVVGVAVGAAETTIKLIRSGGSTRTSRSTAITLETSGAAENAFLVLPANSAGEVVPRVLVCTADGAAALLSVESGALVWVREEALAEISAVHFADMPPGELNLAAVHHALGIHVEGESAGSSGVPIVSAFVRRLVFQLGELVEFVTALPARVSELVAAARADGRGHGDGRGDAPVTRDRYGFRQILLAVTERSVLALHSDGGRVLWKRCISDALPGTLQLHTLRPATHPQPEVVVVARTLTPSGETHTLWVVLDPVDGRLVSQTTLPWDTTLVFRLPLERDSEPLVLLDAALVPHVLPQSREGDAALQELAKAGSLFFHQRHDNTFTGYALAQTAGGVAAVQMWESHVPAGDTVQAVAAPNPRERVESPARVVAEDRVLYRYLNPHMLVIATQSLGQGSTLSGKPAEPSVHIHVLDTVTGGTLYRTVHHRASGPVHALVAENTVMYQYWSTKDHRYEVAVIDLYEAKHSSHVAGNATFSSFTAPLPTVQRQTFLLPSRIAASSVTITARGIAAKQVLFGLSSDSVVTLDRSVLDARRPKPGQAVQPGPLEMLMPYSPHLPLPVTSYVSYHIPVHRVRGIAAAACDLESASLVAAFGLDLFFTRLAPSGYFDTLDHDFQYSALLLTIIGLPAATAVARLFAERKKVARRWA